MPENFLLINKRDADRLGLSPGDRVKVVFPTNPNGEWDLKNGQKVPMIGKVKVVQGIQPGVIAFCLGYGHFAYGSMDIVIDGQVIKADARRSKGVHANAAMRVDPYLLYPWPMVMGRLPGTDVGWCSTVRPFSVGEDTRGQAV